MLAPVKKLALGTEFPSSIMFSGGKDVESTKRQPTSVVANKNKQKEDSKKAVGEKDLRSPIYCLMGHVDSGKTKLLDCIRGTNVEAGGITQQISATYFPVENICERAKELKADVKLNAPGVLVIDTPGHKSFTKFRHQGSGLCDLAILVVDIMHGLEPQTIESLKLLTDIWKKDFIVALNKVDRLDGWKTCHNAPFVKAMKQQSKHVQLEFNYRLTKVISEFQDQGLITELYYKNKEIGKTVSIVPTSAISGEGIPDLLLLLAEWQTTMTKRLTHSNEMKCAVLDVRAIEGYGTTIDVALVNGTLHEGDQIVVCSMQGPIVATIQALLTPNPMNDFRVKGTYVHHKEIKAAQGVKIAAQGIEHAIAGTALYVFGPDDDVDKIKESAMKNTRKVTNMIVKSGKGVDAQASTLGLLVALLDSNVNIPVSGMGIGPVYKKDVIKASVMLEKRKEEGKKREDAGEAVFPCVLKIIPSCVFNTRDPIVLGVDVVAGIAKVGTPICIPQKDFIDIGRIASIENNHKPVDFATKGQNVTIKIIGSNSEEQKMKFGWHFEIEDELVSRLSRASIDALEAIHMENVSEEELKLLANLKYIFNIQ